MESEDLRSMQIQCLTAVLISKLGTFTFLSKITFTLFSDKIKWKTKTLFLCMYLLCGSEFILINTHDGLHTVSKETKQHAKGCEPKSYGYSQEQNVYKSIKFDIVELIFFILPVFLFKSSSAWKIKNLL